MKRYEVVKNSAKDPKLFLLKYEGLEILILYLMVYSIYYFIIFLSSEKVTEYPTILNLQDV